jgi:hypothetical protein
MVQHAMFQKLCADAAADQRGDQDIGVEHDSRETRSKTS